MSQSIRVAAMEAPFVSRSRAALISVPPRDSEGKGQGGRRRYLSHAGRPGLEGCPTVMPQVQEHMYDELAQTKDVKMKPVRMAAITLSLSLLSASAAFAGSASGSSALALAAVIAPYSPDLSPLDKVTVAALFDGESGKV